MLQISRGVETVFDVPRLFFTMRGNPRSEAVVAALTSMVNGTAECLVAENHDEVRTRFEGGISPTSAVVFFDHQMGSKHFSPTTKSRHDDARLFPHWSHGAQWGVKIGFPIAPANGAAADDRAANRTDMLRHNAERCARQVRADFHGNFSARLGKQHFPWGRPKNGEKVPTNVVLGANMDGIVRALNDGPNFKDAIADKAMALELPAESRISWIRVGAEPLKCDFEAMNRVLVAFRCFEEACDRLVRSDAHVQELLLAGVDIESGSDLARCYLFPNVTKFSVRRPDLHFTGDGVYSSENDEMPGGFAELVFLDHVYKVNQDRWERCFRWLTSEGPLVIVVSHEWSKVYIPELTWLTRHLEAKGYPVSLVTTDDMSDLAITGERVLYRGARVGTIWRQFPVFETKGLLADLVFAAHSGMVRMVPEFAHFGNKAWFSIFRSHAEFFRQAFETGDYGQGVFEVLDRILPDSHIVWRGERSFPCTVIGQRIESLEALRELPGEARDLLVLKVCGANTLAARSYGVLMGHGLTQTTWRDWINERLRLAQPFIVQQRLESGIAQIPVRNLKWNCPELFSCRILIRPWTVGEELVSAHAMAVPSNTLRVHGMVDMAVLPVTFE